MTAASAQPSDALVTPGLVRRLAAFVYEGVLLFGVVMIAGYLYATLTQQRHALQGHSGLQGFLFVVLGDLFRLVLEPWRADRGDEGLASARRDA